MRKVKIEKPPSPLKGEQDGVTTPPLGGWGQDLGAISFRSRCIVNVDSPKVYNSANHPLYLKLKLKANQMRIAPTKAEAILWNVINKNQLGVKFRRQHIIDKFIVDFYCLEKSLAVELDGFIHDSQIERDRERDTILNQLGVDVLRIPNNYVENRLCEVVAYISELLKPPSPLKGEQDGFSTPPLGDLGAIPNQTEVM